LSHEIRTPLNAMLTLSQLLRDGSAGQLNVEQKAYVEVIERNGQNLIRLVNDVLDLSRMELGRAELELRSLDVGAQLRATATALVPLADAKNLALVVNVDDGVPPVNGDPSRLRQVLTNLISNAIKFTDRGQVTLAARPGRGVVTVQVSDTGVGIPAPALPRIFDAFFQVGDQSGTAGPEGMGVGLGLAIARRLVRLMGGDLAVESTVGQGSRFTFTLPVSGGGPRVAATDDTGAGTNHETGNEISARVGGGGRAINRFQD
jgi:signal transduction histidine kinase